MKIQTAIVLLSALVSSGSLMAAETEVYRCQGSSYSSVPTNLRKQGCEIVNLRTQTVRSAVPETAQQNNQLPQVNGNQGEISAADLQAAANRKAEEERKAQEEANRKQMEQNAATKASNCNVARMNLQHAQTARVENREQLIQQYQNNVNLYCN